MMRPDHHRQRKININTRKFRRKKSVRKIRKSVTGLEIGNGEFGQVSSVLITGNTYTIDLGGKNWKEKFTRCHPQLPPTYLFTGREQILNELHKTLTTKQQQQQQQETGMDEDRKLGRRMVVLSGLGGMGKSETVRMYAHKYSKEHVNVCWINAGSLESIRLSFNSLAHSMDIPGSVMSTPGKSEEEIVQEVQTLAKDVYTFLCEERRESSLFIFDNAEAMTGNPKTMTCGILPFLPMMMMMTTTTMMTQTSFEQPATTTDRPSITINVLVTSRNRNWGLTGEGIVTLDLSSGLSREETTEFFVKAFDPHHTNPSKLQTEPKMRDALDSLFDLLQGYPLALTHAADHIDSDFRGSCNLLKGIQDYVSMFRELCPPDLSSQVQCGKLVLGSSDHFLILEKILDGLRAEIS